MGLPYACAGGVALRKATSARTHPPFRRNQRPETPHDLQFPLQPAELSFRMVKRDLASAADQNQTRTRVRIGSVRSSSYCTNTCSVHRLHHPLASAFSECCVWLARSCCSRTTTRSTGRSIRTSWWMTIMTRRTGAIRIGWLCRVGWVRGARGLWCLMNRCACVLSVDGLAPECRAAPSHRRDLARLCRAGRGRQGTPSAGWA